VLAVTPFRQAEVSAMAKRLIVCCDGTWNTPNQLCSAKKPTKSRHHRDRRFAPAWLIEYLDAGGPGPVIPVACSAPGNTSATATEARARPGHQSALVQSETTVGGMR
jgi:hypothetical protein